ncbi:MAG TPA: hypothetical protein O0X48_04115 [Methanocorpusculum sp.]|nr:hypothetical protein [Methanocorpusculum sp.]
MGSYNIIAFLALLGFTGVLSLISIIIQSAAVDIANLLIDLALLSQQTVDTVNIILTIMQWSPAAVLVLIAIWAISSHLNNTSGDGY